MKSKPGTSGPNAGLEWATSPADHLAEYAGLNGWSAEDMAGRSGLPIATLAGILSGTVRIGRREADALEGLTGLDQAIWLAIQERHDVITDGLVKSAS